MSTSLCPSFLPADAGASGAGFRSPDPSLADRLREGRRVRGGRMVEMTATGFWRRGRVRDEAAERFAALLLPHLDAAYNLARMLTREDDAAREIVQESCLRALRYRASYRGGNMRAWLLAIVRSRFLEWGRARRMDLSDPLPDGEADDLVSD